jgi:CRP/FNR family transcriptional regulator, cyclic AMP receptor protein
MLDQLCTAVGWFGSDGVRGASMEADGLRYGRDVEAKDLSRARPLAGIAARALDGFALGLERRRFAAGETLIRQGAPPREAFLLEGGRAEIMVRRPGGALTLVAEIGAGELLGEVGLVDDAPRTASAIAREPVTAIVIDRAFFQSALHQRNAAAVQLTRHILATLSERFRATRDRLLGLDAEGAGTPAPLTASERVRRPSRFDYRAFAPLLPFFRHFAADDLEAFLARGQALDVERGEVLFEHGETPERSFVVLRGALVLLGERGHRRRQLAVLGPGRFAGMSAAIAGGAYGATCVVRSSGAVMAFPGALMQELTSSGSGEGVALLHAVCADLAGRLARANNDLAGELLRHNISRGGEADAAAAVAQTSR